jgi:hypothetical protein
MGSRREMQAWTKKAVPILRKTKILTERETNSSTR